MKAKGHGKKVCPKVLKKKTTTTQQQLKKDDVLDFKTHHNMDNLMN